MNKLGKLHLYTAMAFLALGSSAHVQAGVVEEGNPYTPAGANYAIYAIQNVDPTSTNASGATQTGANVNLNFEHNGSTGVTYTGSNGKTTDFGIGLYSPTQSTGLDINYGTPVTAVSVALSIIDIDLNNTNTGFAANKVAPALLVETTIGNYYFSPTQILSNSTFTTPLDGTLSIDFSHAAWGLTGTNITDVVLYGYQDSSNTYNSPSDPYELFAVSNGVNTPEPSTYAILAGCLSVVYFCRRFKAKTSTC